MKKLFAVPTNAGELTQHFGHCEKFAIVEVEDNKVTQSSFLEPPVHQPGVYPRFLADNGISVVIAGGMGQKAQDLFREAGVQVCVGVPADTPEKLVEQYLAGQLATGTNLCDH